jgi:hypothetical protein
MAMTQQYLIGELSELLARLQAVAGDQASAGDVAHLRQDEETAPLAALSWVAVRGLQLTDEMCCDSLTRGDTAAFACQAAIGAQLREFGVCAGLLPEV